MRDEAKAAHWVFVASASHTMESRCRDGRASIRSRSVDHLEAIGRDTCFAGAMGLTNGDHHATKHRTQISAIITRLGIAPPDMSGWKYMEEIGEFQEVQ